MKSKLFKLVLDALFARRMNRNGSCIAWNDAIVELFDESSDALPVIEEVIATVVLPTIQSDKNTRQVSGHCTGDAAPLPIHIASLMGDTANGFPGLKEVLGAYAVIGLREAPERTWHFMKNLPTYLVVNIIRSIPIHVRAQRLAVTDFLNDFLKLARSAEQVEIRAAAQQTLNIVGDPKEFGGQRSEG